MPSPIAEPFYRPTAPQLARIQCHRLCPQDTFALGIDLQRDLAAVDLEDRQIIIGPLGRNLPLRGLFDSAMIAVFPSKDRFQPPYVHSHSIPINEGFSNLCHLAATSEQEVPAVFQLVGRVLIAETALLQTGRTSLVA